VTNDLLRRVAEDREGLIEGFTKKYSLKTLSYFERYENIRDAHSAQEKHEALVTNTESAPHPASEPELARPL
jgi:predicted GIY-YIG superfamily endonuclease